MIWQTAMPILDKLDPLQYYVHYRLFRDSTRYYNKGLVKVCPVLFRLYAAHFAYRTSPTLAEICPK